jgi:hypothetical protein
MKTAVEWLEKRFLETEGNLYEEPNPFELPKALPDDVFYQSLEPKQETFKSE